jgi:hypothetical protein
MDQNSNNSVPSPSVNIMPVDTPSSRWANINWLRVALVALGLLVAGIACTAGFIAIRNNARSTEMRLSNGEAVRLGQASEKVMGALGEDIKPIDEEGRIYRYPADAALPAEVIIYISDGKVGAMLVNRDSGNKHALTGASLGMPIKDLKGKVGWRGSPKPISTETDAVKQKGYKVAGSKSSAYYITASCGRNTNQRITQIGLALKGQEKLLGPLLKPRTCSKPTETAKPQPQK